MHVLGVPLLRFAGTKSIPEIGPFGFELLADVENGYSSSLREKGGCCRSPGRAGADHDRVFD